MQIQIYFSLIVGTCALALALAFFAFRQRKNVPGVRVFAYFATAEAFLALSELFSMVSKSPQNALFWFNNRSIFLAVAPVLWLIFIYLYYQRQAGISKWAILVLSIIPLGTIIIPRVPAISHLWVQQNVSFFQVESFWLVDTSTRLPGFWFYIHTFFSFLMVCLSLLIIVVDFLKKLKVKRLLSLLLFFGSIAFLGAGIYPSFFPVGQTMLNPIIPAIGIGELLHVISIFSLNFLMPEPKVSKIIDPDAIKNQERESFSLLILIFVLIAASIASLGFLSYQNFQRQYRSQVEAQLTSISLLKVADIQNWQDERLSDAQFFYQNKSFSQFIENSNLDPLSNDEINHIKDWFKAFKSHPEYDQVFLVNSTFDTIVSDSESEINLAQHLKAEIPKILEDGIIKFIDFHRDADNNPVYLAMVVPIYSSTGTAPLGVVVFRIDPQVYLYPQILEWPVPSESAETALVRMQDNQVVYLTDLRFEPNAILTKFIDLSETNRPSVKAVSGNIGIVEGINYRGKQVIADVRPVPGTPWFLVSRIDQDEITAPLLERERLSWILYSSLIVATGIGLNLIWRQQKTRSLVTNYKIQTEILERDRKLKEAQELAHIGFWYWDVNTGEVEWSEEVYKIFHIDPKSFTPKIDTIMALSPWPEDQNRNQELIDRAIRTHKPGKYEQKFLRPDQSIGYYSSTFLGQFDEKENLKSIVGSIIDITDRTIKDQALQESEHRFKTLFEHAAVGVAIIDTKTGLFQDINQKYCDFLGYTKQEMLQKRYQSLIDPEFVDTNQQFNRKLISGKIKEYSVEKRYVRKDGRVVWGELNASALWEPSDIPSQYLHIAVVKDITEQKIAEFALRESEKKFRETVANLDEGFFSTTIDGILIDHNEAFNQILGFQKNEDLRGRLAPDFWVDVEDRQKYLKEIKKKGFVSSFEVTARRIDGKKINLLLSAHIVKDENNVSIKTDGVFLDITERIKQEEQLINTQTELQKLLDQAEQSRRALLTIVEDQKIAQEEIVRLNKTLEERVNQRTAQLKASNEELESFAYSISHDLRAPLRAIDGYSRILEQDYANVLDSEGIRLLNIVRSSTKNLDKLITDLLSLSRVGRSELKLEVLPMDSMVDSVFNEITTPEIQERITLNIHDLPDGWGDATLVRHVWMNLISNAIKYSTPKEHPYIEIFGKSEPDKCIYTVKDNGVGFNPDFKDKLFGLFQRLHKASDFEGTGVGLAIVNRIVTRHNGEVWGDGATDLGAEFTFTLPKKSENDEQ